MLIVDSHVHIALHMYEPVEILLAQMQHNQVEKTVLVQSSTTTDNTYVIESMRRFPGKFSVVCRVDVDSTELPALSRRRSPCHLAQSRGAGHVGQRGRADGRLRVP